MHKRYIPFLLFISLFNTSNATKKRTYEHISQSTNSISNIFKPKTNSPINNKKIKDKIRKILLQNNYIAKGFRFSDNTISQVLRVILEHADTKTLTSILETDSEYYKDILSNHAHEILNALASENEKLECLKKCLEYNPHIARKEVYITHTCIDIDKSNNYTSSCFLTERITILHMACDKGLTSIMQKLLEENYISFPKSCISLKFKDSLNNKEYNKYRETILGYALRKDLLSSVQFLISQGYEEPFERSTISPLEWAIFHRSKNVIKYIINNGIGSIDLNINNSELLKYNQSKILNLFSDSLKSDTNFAKQLYYLNDSNNSEFFKPIMTNQAFSIINNKNLRDLEKQAYLKNIIDLDHNILNIQRLNNINGLNDFYTLLHRAIAVNSLNLVKFLLNYVNVEQTTIINKLTPLAIACLTKNTEIAKELINRGAKTTQLNKNNDSLLHLAVSTQDYHFIKSILDNKFNFKNALHINSKNNSNETPVMFALVRYNFKILHLLLSYDPDLTGITTGSKSIPRGTTIDNIIGLIVNKLTRTFQNPPNNPLNSNKINEIISTFLVCLEYNLINTTAPWYHWLITRLFPNSYILSRQICLEEDITETMQRISHPVNQLDLHKKSTLMWAIIKSNNEQTIKKLLNVKTGIRESQLRNATTADTYDIFSQTPLSKALYLANKATTIEDKRRYIAFYKIIYDYLKDKRILLSVRLGNKYIDNDNLDPDRLTLNRSHTEVAKLERLLTSKEEYDNYTKTIDTNLLKLGHLKLILKQAIKLGDSQAILALLPFEFNNNFNDIRKKKEKLLSKNNIDQTQRIECSMLLRPDISFEKHNVLNLIEKSSLESNRIENRTRTSGDIHPCIPNDIIMEHIAPYIFGEYVPYYAFN